MEGIVGDGREKDQVWVRQQVYRVTHSQRHIVCTTTHTHSLYHTELDRNLEDNNCTTYWDKELEKGQTYTAHKHKDTQKHI